MRRAIAMLHPVVHYFGESFRRCNANGEGNSHTLPHGLAHAVSLKKSIVQGQARFEEAFVDGIHLLVFEELVHDVHHASRNTAVQLVIGTASNSTMFEGCLSDLKPGDAFRNIRFSLCCARDNTAVVIGEHENRLVRELRVENALAGGVEAISVGKNITASACREHSTIDVHCVGLLNQGRNAATLRGCTCCRSWTLLGDALLTRSLLGGALLASTGRGKQGRAFPRVYRAKSHAGCHEESFRDKK